MSSQGTGEDGDHERQRAPRSRPGTHESVDDTRHQLQIQSVQIPTTRRGEAHAMLAYTLPVGQETATPVTDAQTGAVQPIYTHANLSEGDRFSQSSTLTSDMAMTAENKSTVGLHPSADFVRRENYSPVAPSKMSNQGWGKDGDQEHEKDRALNSYSGIHESAFDTGDQLPIQGVWIETIPKAEAHAMLAYTLPLGQGTAISFFDTQIEAISPIYTLANTSEENCFSQSTASVPDMPLIAGNNSTVVVQPTAAAVQQETYPPTADVQPQQHYNLSNIYGQHILAKSPIAPPRQMMVRGPQSTVEHTPTTFAHMEDGPRMTNILRQSNYSAEVNSVGQICAQDISGESTGAQARETTQVLGRPINVVAPIRVGVQQKVVSSLRKRKVYSLPPVRALHGPPVYYVRTPSAVNMERQVTASTTKYVAHTSTTQSNIPTESQIPLTPTTETESIQCYEPETNAAEYSPAQEQQTGGYVTQQTSNAAIKHDMTLNADHNTNEKVERRIPEQVSAVSTSHQMPHTRRTRSNIGLQQQENVSTNNPSNTERANTPSYNSPATSSQMSPVLTDTPDLVQEEGDSSVHDRHMTQLRKLVKLFALDPEIVNLLIPAELQRVLDSRDRLLRKERGQSNREYTLRPEDQAETGAGDIPVVPTASAVTEREGDAQSVTAEQQVAHYSTSGPQRRRVRPNLRAHILDDDTDCYMCRDEAYHCMKQENHTCNAHCVNKTQKYVLHLKPDHVNNSSHSSETKNMNKKGSFPRVASDTLHKKNKSPRGISSQLRVAQAGGSSANMSGENNSTGRSPLLKERQASLQSRENSEVTFSCMTDTVIEGTPNAVVQQQVTEAQGGRQKRHCDLNEYSTPAAKRQATIRLGTELQHEKTTFVPPQIDYNTSLSAKQDTADDMLGSAALSVTTEDNENILECDYLNTCMELNETETQTVEDGDDGEYDGGLYAMDVPRQEQIVEQQEADFLPDVPQADVMLERQNATEELPNDMMSISQKLPEGNIDYKETEDNVDDVTFDSEEIFASHANKDYCMELDETETQTVEERDDGECDDGLYATDLPRQEQLTEEQEADFLPGVPQADVMIEIANIMSECLQMIANSQQLPEGNIYYKETKDNVVDVTSDSEEMFASHADKDCCMEFNETETQKAEDGNKGECDNGMNNTAIPRQEEILEEQETDVPQADVEGTISDDQEDEADTIVIEFYL